LVKKKKRSRILFNARLIKGLVATKRTGRQLGCEERCVWREWNKKRKFRNRIWERVRKGCERPGLVFLLAVVLVVLLRLATRRDGFSLTRGDKGKARDRGACV
jgi:hypothetical protein